MDGLAADATTVDGLGPLGPVFNRLKTILQRNADRLSVTDHFGRYAVEGEPGPATLAAWGGKTRRQVIPVAWTEIGKHAVTFHLMGLQGHATTATIEAFIHHGYIRPRH